jgi:Zn-dependent protease
VGANFSIEQFRLVMVSMISLILSITVHEFGHALVADRLGDRLPRSQGRVTLNPIAHMSVLGTLVLPLMGLLLGGFVIGWGKPVQIQPMGFTRRVRMKTGHLLVAAAGPAMNVLFGIVIALVLVLVTRFGIVRNPEVQMAIVAAVRLNFVLAFFNLLPFPPLDGGAVLAGILPDRSPVLEFLHTYGFYLLILVFVLPQAQMLFSVPALWLTKLCFGLLGVY